MRQESEIKARLASLCELYMDGSDEWLEGTIDALRWVLGVELDLKTKERQQH